MQFSKLLPTVLVAVGICTWTFMAAQDEHPGEEDDLRVPRKISNLQVQTADRAWVTENTSFIVPLPESNSQESADVITRVAVLPLPPISVPQVAAIALAQIPPQPSIQVYEFPQGGTPSQSAIVSPTKQTRVRVKIGLTTPATITNVKSIKLNIAFTVPGKRSLVHEVLRSDCTPEGTSLTFDLDFKAYLNEGAITLTAIIVVGNDESLPTTPVNLDFQEYELPKLSITSVASTDANPPTTGTAPAVVTIAENQPYTNRRNLQLSVAINPPANSLVTAELRKPDLKFYVFAGGTQIAEIPVTKVAALTQTLNVSLPRTFEGPAPLSVRYTTDPATVTLLKSGFSDFSNVRTVVIDTTPPEIIDARLITPNTLEVRFRDADLGSTAKTATNYKYAKSSEDPNGGVVAAGITTENSIVRLTIGNLNTDTYQLLPQAAITDLAGNSINTKNIATFNSFPDRERGEHVEFPEFTPRADRDKTRVFNPGDKVETRVARLYYYRDAHRVAEIVNRNVKSLNRAAVKVSEQLAEQSREDADRITGERQANERQAIFEAQQTRTMERDIQQKEREIAAMQADKTRLDDKRREADRAIVEAQQLQTALTDSVKPIIQDPSLPPVDPSATNPAAPGPNGTLPDSSLTSRNRAAVDARLKAAQDLKVNLTADIEAINTRIADTNADLTNLQAKATASRMAEFQSREAVAKKQFDEDRARASQFRKEVAAASADPDTYVAGQVDSPDPVTQVSVSVIGEGLIQLRGPIRGINTIREMISQIDSPVGQVKVGIHTVQINGEHGDRMEVVASRIEASLKLGQNLTSQSLMLLRRAVQEVAAEMVDLASSPTTNGHRQIDRDRRYLYNFFGRDFTDELYEMDSEFLKSENKLLGLHSMDTLSIAQAMFIMALAKNDVRQLILQRFRHLVMCELPEAEWDHRRTTKLLPRKFNTLEEVILNANARYHFRNLYAFVNAQVNSADTMTPTQREFLRLAQIFKSQLVAEMEYKQRVMERGLLEDQSNSEDDLRDILNGPHRASIKRIGDVFTSAVEQTSEWSKVWQNPIVQGTLAEAQVQIRPIRKVVASAKSNRLLIEIMSEIREMGIDDNDMELVTAEFLHGNSLVPSPQFKDVTQRLNRNAKLIAMFENMDAQQMVLDLIAELKSYVFETVAKSEILSFELKTDLENRAAVIAELKNKIFAGRARGTVMGMSILVWRMASNTDIATSQIETELQDWIAVASGVDKFRDLVEDPSSNIKEVRKVFGELDIRLERILARLSKSTDDAKNDFNSKPNRSREQQYINYFWIKYGVNFEAMQSLQSTVRTAFETVRDREYQIKAAGALEKRTRGSLDHRKIMDFHIDEQAEKVVELAEGTRSHIAQMDNYLKRMFIALEDDFQAQFYDPAFEDIRRASRTWDVNLGQVERTTLLGNNRTLMKVSPQATMEFDLPKRHTAIFEGMAVAKAAYQEYGALVTDPNFLGLSKMASGSPAVGGDPRFTGQGGTYRDTMQSPSVKNVLPGLGSSSDEQMFSQVAGNKTQFGAALEGLIPDPAVYKFETGTGFEIRPVIQPDGTSLVFDFDYMYTTNVREPIRADEKHLGRVKRHFIHTQVQTTSFELREISRYLVALKASRTSRGVPLLEDVPVLGGLFRPLPSAESSLQQNIILSQSMAYPTLFDLMGLRWSKHLVDLDHVGLRDSEHVVRGRYQTVRDFTFDESAKNFDEFLDIEKKQPDHFRPDLYHRNAYPSPYHPGGYHNRKVRDENDPTGRRYTVPDNRPPEMQDPRYDPKFRRPINEEPVGPGQLLPPQAVGPGERINPNEEPQLFPPKPPEQIGPGQLLSPEFIEEGMRLEPGPSENTNRRTETRPRGSRPMGSVPGEIAPSRPVRKPIQRPVESDNQSFEPIQSPQTNEGTPMGRKGKSSLLPIPTVGRASAGSVKWVVNEQPTVPKSTKGAGYQQIEPRYLPPPATTKGLPSLKQLIPGGKSTDAIQPKAKSNPPPSREPQRPGWSRLRIELEGLR